MFARAWQLLTSNWQIVVPGFLLGAVGAIVSTILAPSPTSSDLNRSLGNVALGGIQVVVSILSIAYTTGMAQAAWERGKATYADGFRAFKQDGLNIVVAMIGMLLLGIVALVTLPFTVGLSFALYIFFFIFTMPGAVVGERPGLLAMRDSCLIAFKRPIPTVLMVLALAAMIAVMGVFAALLTAAPLIGPIVADVIVQAAIAYLTLVTVGEYLALRRVAAFMIPLPIRLAIVLLGLALFVGSWFIGNSVDSGGMADLPSSSVMAKDGLTFGARVVGVFIMVAGLLMWVVSENTVNHHGLF